MFIVIKKIMRKKDNYMMKLFHRLISAMISHSSRIYKSSESNLWKTLLSLKGKNRFRLRISLMKKMIKKVIKVKNMYLSYLIRFRSLIGII